MNATVAVVETDASGASRAACACAAPMFSTHGESPAAVEDRLDVTGAAPPRDCLALSGDPCGVGESWPPTSPPCECTATARAATVATAPAACGTGEDGAECNSMAVGDRLLGAPPIAATHSRPGPGRRSDRGAAAATSTTDAAALAAAEAGALAEAEINAVGAGAVALTAGTVAAGTAAMLDTAATAHGATATEAAAEMAG